MGTVFRRSFRDKKTGRTKRVGTYTLKFRDAHGVWLTEPTDAFQKHVAQRLLRERELQVQQEIAFQSCHSTNAPAIHPERSTPPPAEPVSILLTELRDLYLPAIRVRLSQSTTKMYREALNFILPRLHSRTADMLNLQQIERFMQQRLEGGTAPRTINIQVAVAKRMLTWAEKQGLIATNPIAKWQPLREVQRRKRRSMLPDEVKTLLAVAPLHRRVAYAVFVASGVRRGELIQLERDDLDLKRGVLVLRPELTKSGKGRRVFLPQGLVDLLSEYLEQDLRERPKRQNHYLARVRQRLARLEEAGQSESSKAERLRFLEDVIVKSRGHRYLFVNGKGLPIRRNSNLVREFRKDLRKAGIDAKGLDLHSLRYTTNTTMLKGGVNPSIIRARLGHGSARMTERYCDKEALDQGGETGPIADLLGVPDGELTANADAAISSAGGGLTLESEEQLRPRGNLLAGLVERYSNLLIARLCRVSEAAVRKWLKAEGLVRSKRIITAGISDGQLALLRADLRAALATSKSERNGRSV